LELAYQDIKDAFNAFNAKRGTDRPFILAGHSQGSMLLIRLLNDLAGSSLLEKLVVAYLPGSTISEEQLQRFGLEPCTEFDQLHCVAAWNARGPAYQEGKLEMVRDRATTRLCTNPISWRAGRGSRDRVAVFLETADHSPLAGVVETECQEGTLVVFKHPKLPRDWMSWLLDRALGEGNLHPVEYQLFWLNRGFRDLRSLPISSVNPFQGSEKGGSVSLHAD
jgi:hypothetical protein